MWLFLSPQGSVLLGADPPHPLTHAPRRPPTPRTHSLNGAVLTVRVPRGPAFVWLTSLSQVSWCARPRAGPVKSGEIPVRQGDRERGPPHHSVPSCSGPSSGDLFCDFNCGLKGGSGIIGPQQMPVEEALPGSRPRQHRRRGELSLFGTCSLGGLVAGPRHVSGGCRGRVPVAPASPCRAVGVSHQVAVTYLDAGSPAQPREEAGLLSLTPVWSVCLQRVATPLGDDAEP